MQTFKDDKLSIHYVNMAFQRKKLRIVSPKKKKKKKKKKKEENIQLKNSGSFHMSALNIDCEYHFDDFSYTILVLKFEQISITASSRKHADIILIPLNPTFM